MPLVLFTAAVLFAFGGLCGAIQLWPSGTGEGYALPVLTLLGSLTLAALFLALSVILRHLDALADRLQAAQPPAPAADHPLPHHDLRLAG